MQLAQLVVKKPMRRLDKVGQPILSFNPLIPRISPGNLESLGCS